MGLVILPHFSVNKLPWASWQNRDLNIMQSKWMELPHMSTARECVWTALRPLHIDFSTSAMHWFLWRAYSDNEQLPSSGHGLHSNTCLSSLFDDISFQKTLKNIVIHIAERKKKTFFNLLIFWHFYSYCRSSENASILRILSPISQHRSTDNRATFYP